MTQDTHQNEDGGNTPQPDHAGQVIQCGALLNIGGAAALRETLLEACQGDAPVILDLAEPERIDTAGIQLLCSFINYSKQKAVPLQWRNVPEALHVTAAQLGLGELLEISPE